jgi:hypothetical protein
MRPFEITKDTLKNLIAKSKSQSIELPSFQREYTWEIEKQKGLIASIFCGIPASSFLVYKGETKFEVRDLGIKGTKLRQSSPTSAQLLDGQQRLTTIYSAFSNIYNSNNPPNQFFNKITNKWFLKIDYSNITLDLFNLQTLNFRQSKISKESSTESLADILIVKSVSDPKSFCYFEKTDTEINQYCIENNLLPLYYLEKDIDKIRIILSAIAENYRTKLQTWLEFETEKEITSNFIKNQPNSKFESFLTNQDECKKNLANITNSWVDGVRDYFSNFLDYYDQSIVQINDIDKIVEAFYVINTGGIKLTTFDLLCAKLNKLKLRTLIESNLNEEHNSILRDSKRTKIRTSEILKIIDSHNEIKPKYHQYFTYAFGLYYKLNKLKAPINTLSPDDIKSQKILNIDFDSIDENDIKSITKSINRTLIFLATHCSLRSIDKITNELALIPIISLSISYPGIFDNKNGLELIKKFYFQRVLLGIYNSNQNANCIKDSVMLFNIHSESKFGKGKKPTTEKFNELTELEILRNDFIKFENINHWDKNNIVNQSAKDNILYFIEAFTANQAGLADFCNPTYHIKYNDDIEIHHVIPIGSVSSKFSEAYKNYRKIKHHRINSVLNLAVITKATNKKIGDATVQKYMERIKNPGILGSHLIADDFKSNINLIPEDVSAPLTKDEEKLQELYNDRYQKILELACQVLIIN